jgi:uncharacterized protein YrrD
MKAAVCQELGVFEDVFFIADRLEIITYPVYHGLEKIVFLRLAKGFNMNDYLVLPIHCSYPIIALDHAFEKGDVRAERS